MKNKIIKDCGRENEMDEFVGFCSDCGKPIYCLNGFLNGVVIDGKGTLHCFYCHKKTENIREKTIICPDSQKTKR
jgi:hypothetical protein